MRSILNELTPDDVRHLIQFEDELTQLGRYAISLGLLLDFIVLNVVLNLNKCIFRFEKVFPTPHTHIYHQFFDSPRYYNMMLDAWETRYHKNRVDGVKLLEGLCQQKLHLIVPFPGGKTKVSRLIKI